MLGFSGFISRRELLAPCELRQLCGFDPFLGEKAVPTKDAFSRFLELLIEHRSFIVEMFHELRELAFFGFEKDRMSLKYRCPAAAFGLECAGRAECEKLSPIGVGKFGRVVRVPLELNRRIFTPISRHTDKWEKAYHRRTSVERVNSRLDQVLGFEHHTVRGKAKMEMRVTLALVVILAMAVGRIRIGQTDRMRSLVAPIVRAA